MKPGASMTLDLPPGFALRPEFLSENEERELLADIQTIPFGAVQMHGVTAKRRVAQFGWHYSFETWKLAPAAPISREFVAIREHAAALAGIDAEQFSETLVTEYPPGAGIGWHRDARRSGSSRVSPSVGSAACVSSAARGESA